MTAEEQRELQVVFHALHTAATLRERWSSGVPEQRGKAYGPPEWHEGAELWTRALAVANADPDAFGTEWTALVAQARTYLKTIDQAVTKVQEREEGTH